MECLGGLALSAVIVGAALFLLVQFFMLLFLDFSQILGEILIELSKNTQLVKDMHIFHISLWILKSFCWLIGL